MAGTWKQALIGAVVGGATLYLFRRFISLNARETVRAVSTSSSKTFDTSLFQRQNKAKIIGKIVVHMTSCDSTMSLARSFADSPLDRTGAIFIAEEQTKGIGRRSRTWKSESAGNLYVSMLWKGALEDTFNIMKMLNFAAPLAVVKAAQIIGVQGAVAKWPNDVWVGGKKLSGCIVDRDANTDYIILGIGINVNQIFGEETREKGLAGATSLRECLGLSEQTEVSREDFLADFCFQLDTFLTSYSFDQLMSEYRKVDMLANQVVRVHHVSREVDDPRDFNALVTGIHSDGRLVVTNQSTNEPELLSGHEVSIGVFKQ